jgi:SAM-dependent methyltransferase
VSEERIQLKVEKYYSGKIREFGVSARGVDWNSEETQELRFQQLSRIFVSSGDLAVNDLGCGYGAFLPYLRRSYPTAAYRGYDLSADMVTAARRLFADDSNAVFYESSGLISADYTVASGIFNVKLDTAIDEWEAYILQTLRRMDESSVRGFAFNVLTSYSDESHRRPDLYYADPLRLFDFCKAEFSRNIALLHDYGLYEFTILVRKDL